MLNTAIKKGAVSKGQPSFFLFCYKEELCSIRLAYAAHFLRLWATAINPVSICTF
jgi:hypothetical protein